MIVDPRDFYDGPAPEGEPFELTESVTPVFDPGPEGVEALCRALGLPMPRVPDWRREFGDPESKW